MPVLATFHNTTFDIRCSKCKRTQENQNFVDGGRLFKTCNNCRERARWRRVDPDFIASLRRSPSVVGIRRIPDTDDSDNEPSINPRASLHALGFDYDYTAIDNVLSLSSSAAAAASSSSSAGYFVAEPDPEPEPEGPKGV